MRKMTFLACTAIALTSIAFTGCKGDKNEPGQQQNVPSVTTDISISLPANATGGARRMPGVSVQKHNGTDDFQGIKDIHLIPFGLAKNATVVSTDKKLGAKLTGIGNIAATSELAAVSKAKKYTNVAVPTGTSAFLFYAESAASSDNFNKGYLNYVEATTTAGTAKFELGTIVSGATDVTNHAAHTALLAYVQSVADATDGTKAWKNYTTDDNEGFKMLFDEYKTTKNFNSFNIERMMNDLLSTIELTDNTLADNMRAAIKSESYVTYDASTKKVTLKTTDNLNNFPACLNLPDGSVSIAYNDGTGTFGTSTDKNFVDKTTTSNMQMAPVELYTYPSALWYYANTTIYTANQSEDDALTSTTKNWNEVLTEYTTDGGTANGSVNSKTRSIALTSPINYAVGRFDVQVKLGSASLNDAALPTATSIPCNEEGKKFTLTAVLVGGQKNVGFDFTPTTYPATSPIYTIYDKIIEPNPYTITTEFVYTNSTLVLETTNAGTEADNVMIAIELQNNTGKDFVGADGIIPAGGKFYLVGKLTADDANITDKKVFKKDYVTKAELNIGDLTKAYNGIPDLRTPTLEIGLSVNLQWEEGYTYHITL